MNHVIIVESPAKARTLKKFLGAKYNIKASMNEKNRIFNIKEIISRTKRIISFIKERSIEFSTKNDITINTFTIKDINKTLSSSFRLLRLLGMEIFFK